mmetsp:Transcript_11277/g.23372  ORF Transcript_11277/g.23372 Transcript_11277/m.23372 type:complete len:278 (-) Transcript_11277:19-852(-)
MADLIVIARVDDAFDVGDKEMGSFSIGINIPLGSVGNNVVQIVKGFALFFSRQQQLGGRLPPQLSIQANGKSTSYGLVIRGCESLNGFVQQQFCCGIQSIGIFEKNTIRIRWRSLGIVKISVLSIDLEGWWEITIRGFETRKNQFFRKRFGQLVILIQYPPVTTFNNVVRKLDMPIRSHRYVRKLCSIVQIPHGEGKVGRLRGIKVFAVARLHENILERIISGLVMLRTLMCFQVGCHKGKFCRLVDGHLGQDSTLVGKSCLSRSMIAHGQDVEALQ